MKNDQDIRDMIRILEILGLPAYIEQARALRWALEDEKQPVTVNIEEPVSLNKSATASP